MPIGALLRLESICGIFVVLEPVHFKWVQQKCPVSAPQHCRCVKYSVMESKTPGAAIYNAALEPILVLIGAENRSHLFKVAPAAKKKSLVLVLSMNSVHFIKIKSKQEYYG